MRHLAPILFSLLFSTSVGAQSIEPRLAGAPTHRTCTQAEVQQALAGEYVGSVCRFTNLPERSPHGPATQVSPPPLRASSVASISGRRQSIRDGSRHESAYRSVSTERRSANSVVTLPDTFFAGPSAGGVERYAPPLYSYRGLILIAADGRVSYGTSLLAHRSNIVRAMDRIGPTPPRSAYSQRVYPAY
jgi:hypothetical protein